MHDVTIRKKVMISQPMNDLTDEEIEKTREKAIRHLDRLGYKVVSTLFKDGWYNNSAMKDRGVMNIPVYYLARSLESMSFCDAVYFCDGWEDYRGCRIEHDVAEEYGLDIIYQEKEEPLTSDEKAFIDGIRYAHDKLKQYSSEDLGTIINRMEELTETTEERLRVGDLLYLGDRCE